MYISRDKIEEYLGKKVEKTEDELNFYITTATEMIDSYTDRFPLYSNVSTTKEYRGDGTNKINIDNLRKDSPYTVVVNNTEIPYEIDKIFKDSFSVLEFQSNLYKSDIVLVTGKFGVVSAINPKIELACIMLVQDLLEDDASEIKAETIGKYKVEYTENTSNTEKAYKLLDSYKRMSL